MGSTAGEPSFKPLPLLSLPPHLDPPHRFTIVRAPTLHPHFHYHSHSNPSFGWQVFPHAFALTQLSQADGERLRTLARTSVKAFAAPSNGTDLPLVHALDSRLAQLAGLGTLQMAQAVEGPLHKTLCLLLKREYECLAGLRYTAPTACAAVT